MLENIVITSAKKEDVNDLTKLYGESILKTERAIDNNLAANFSELDELKEWFEEDIENSDSFILIAKLKGELVGFINFSFALPKSAYIIPVINLGNIGVSTGHRRKGIAKTLYNEMLKVLNELGEYQIRLSFFPQNLAASELYKNLGFTEYSVTHQKKITQS